MEKESIIAQVDYSTEQIMKDISNDITAAIGNDLQDIKDDTKAIEDIIEQTEEITNKLRGFDGLSSSLADLKAYAKESKLLAEKISPLESQLIDLHKNIGNGFEQSNNKTRELISGIGALQSAIVVGQNSVNDIFNTVSNIHTVISSVEKTQNNNFAEVSEVLRDTEEKDLSFKESALQSLTLCKESIQLANDKIASVLSSLITTAEKVEITKADVSQLITANSASTLNAFKNENDSIKQSIGAVSQKLQDVDAYVHQRTNELDTRIESIYAELQVFSHQNEVQINTLKESLEKVQVTLDIIVNLTTPFWKKWGK